jgi:N-acetylneuraminic acid mutarotase
MKMHCSNNKILVKFLRHIFSIIGAIIALTACNREDPKPFSNVTTLKSVVPENGGVVMYGQINSLRSVSKILRYGFFYADTPELRSYHPRIYVEEPARAGQFKGQLDVGILPDITYYYWAFIEYENGQQVFGESQSFFSVGGKQPVITEVIPTMAHIGDTVTIRGRYLNDGRFYVPIYFDQKLASQVASAKGEIKCIVPDQIFGPNVSIVIKASGLEAEAKLQLFTPIIENLSPSLVTFRDTIEITGQHFEINKRRTKVYLAETEAEIVTTERNKIKVIVPDSLRRDGSPVVVRAQGQEVTSDLGFNLHPPEFSLEAECLSTFDEITIDGRYFHPIASRNIVYFEGTAGTTVSGTTSTLKVRVPAGPFPRGLAEVKVLTANVSTTADTELCIDDPWLLIEDQLPFYFHYDPGAFVIDNTAYVVASKSTTEDPTLYLWEFDASENSWTNHSIPFAPGLSAICVGNGSNGYFYTTAGTDNFWEFDGQTKQWTKKADFPGQEREAAAAFSIGANVYIGIGVINVNGREEAGKDFYKYSPATNSWTQISAPAFPINSKRANAATFTIDNIAYLMAGSSNYQERDAWRYLAASDTWERIADLPDARNGTFSFSLNGKGYVSNGRILSGGETNRCWEYDPLTNRWTDMGRVGYFDRRGGFAFVVGGIAYAGGGNQDYIEYVRRQLFFWHQ